MNASATQATLFRARTMAVIGNHQWFAEKDRARTCAPLSNDHQPNTNCSLPTACGFSLSGGPLSTGAAPQPAARTLTYAGEEGNLVIPEENHARPTEMGDVVRVFSVFCTHVREPEK